MPASASCGVPGPLPHKGTMPLGPSHKRRQGVRSSCSRQEMLSCLVKPSPAIGQPQTRAKSCGATSRRHCTPLCKPKASHCSGHTAAKPSPSHHTAWHSRSTWPPRACGTQAGGEQTVRPSSSLGIVPQQGPVAAPGTCDPAEERTASRQGTACGPQGPAHNVLYPHARREL